MVVDVEETPLLVVVQTMASNWSVGVYPNKLVDGVVDFAIVGIE